MSDSTLGELCALMDQVHHMHNQKWQHPSDLTRRDLWALPAYSYILLDTDMPLKNSIPVLFTEEVPNRSLDSIIGQKASAIERGCATGTDKVKTGKSHQRGSLDPTDICLHLMLTWGFSVGRH
ncbi:hypothetical protein CB1_000256036 [Camelus ferus]|nr:hypothetical protein CB1_000256036 [Camelus ferus]